MKAKNYYAWDFHIVRGQYICAARDGKVSRVHDSEPVGNENSNNIYVAPRRRRTKRVRPHR